MRDVWIIGGIVICTLVLIYIFKRDFFINAYYSFLEMKYRVMYPDANF